MVWRWAFALGKSTVAPHPQLPGLPFRLADAFMAQLTESKPLSSLKAADFDAVFLPGGHGVCWDFPGALQAPPVALLAAGPPQAASG